MLTIPRHSIGTDPELFIADERGNIVGSELVLGSEPNPDPIPTLGSYSHASRNPHGKVVKDGIQVELNPSYTLDIPSLAANIKGLLAQLQAKIDTTNKTSPRKFKMDFSGVVKVARAEMDLLDPSSLQFGCQPSFNIYGYRPILVSGETYPVRAGGGHIHLGGITSIYQPHVYNEFGDNHPIDERERLVGIMELVVGNTCVLLDRDPGQKERRLNYGRAGEYRHQPHGLEYRTLSNFWLRNYYLLNFVFSLASLSVGILDSTLSTNGRNYEDFLLERADFSKIRTAIDNNDVELAKENFEHLKKFVVDYLPNGSYALTKPRVKKFEQFAAAVQSKGMEALFPTEPYEFWSKWIPDTTWVNYIDGFKGV